MDDLVKEIATDISLDYLQQTEIGTNLSKALSKLEKVQDVAYAYVTDPSSEKLKLMRVGTVLTFAILKKAETGKLPNKYSVRDWEEIAEKVANNAILIDPQEYSISVFNLYAKYIDVSADALKGFGISDDKCDEVRAVAERIRALSESVRNGEIPEVEYTDECLWTILEAMIKFLGAYSILLVGEEKGEIIQAISMLAFEYGRYALYRQENEMLEQFILNQRILDAELQTKLEEFNQAMQKKMDEFNYLVNNAFDPNIMQRFKSSIAIARATGVNESEILTSTEGIDDYFL